MFTIGSDGVTKCRLCDANFCGMLLIVSTSLYVKTVSNIVRYLYTPLVRLRKHYFKEKAFII